MNVFCPCVFHNTLSTALPQRETQTVREVLTLRKKKVKGQTDGEETKRKWSLGGSRSSGDSRGCLETPVRRMQWLEKHALPQTVSALRTLCSVSKRRWWNWHCHAACKIQVKRKRLEVQRIPTVPTEHNMSPLRLTRCLMK